MDNPTFAIEAIPAEVLAELRDRDDAGRAPETSVGQGGEPLRCCLRYGLPGEEIALLSYAPLRRWAAVNGAAPGPYEELGPVFIHARKCGGFTADRVPQQHAYATRVCRAYDDNGRIRGGLLVDPAHPAAAPTVDAAMRQLFTEPDTALVHVRAVEYGCFQYLARRIVTAAS